MSTTKTARLPRATDDRDWWSVPEWAGAYGFSVNAAYAMCQRGEVPGAHLLGRRWRISKVAFLRSFHGQDPTTDAA